MKVLNRPMFRKGGQSKGTGVMSMVEPRENFKMGTAIENIRQLGTQYEQALRKSAQPSAGEKAALIAQIASTPGGLYEKITATLPTQAKIFAGQRAIEPKILESKMKQEATIAGLEAKARGTTSAKMKEFQARRDFLFNQKEQELGRPLTQAEKNVIINQAQEETIAKMPRSTSVAPNRETVFNSMVYSNTPFANKLSDATTAFNNAVTNLRQAKDSKKYAQYLAVVKKKKKEIDSYYEQIQKNSGFNPVKDKGLVSTDISNIPLDYKSAKQQVNFLITRKAEGGRIMKAQGDIVTGAIEEQVNTTYGEPELKSFGYEELRGKLPPEVDNGIVKLLATSEDALRDFAYITTQQDINQFNQKYGVNLTLPVSG